MAIKWHVFEKVGGRKSKYVKYLEKVVVISVDRGLILTPATLNLLGNPKRILLLNDGNGNMGLRPVNESDPLFYESFAVIGSSKDKKSSDNSHVTSVVNCLMYNRRYGIESHRVFSTISVENDILVVNLNKFEILKISN